MKILTKNNVIFIIVILILAFVYIRDMMNKTVEVEQEPIKAVETIATSTDIVIKESTDFYDIDAKYPNESLDTNRIMEKYVKDTVNTYKEDWKIGGEVYNTEKEISTTYTDRPATKYLLNITYEKFESKMPETVTYVFEEYTFAGGAHGNTLIEAYTFDKTGKVEIESFLKLKENNNDIALTKLLESKLKTTPDNEYFNLNILRDGLGLSLLKSDGVTIDPKKNKYNFSFESNFKKFIILDEGITFIFDPYQIASYIEGSPEVILTWDELKPYLNLKNN
jgi:hypothetical protein